MDASPSSNPQVPQQVLQQPPQVPGLPALPDLRDLADACRTAAAREGVQPWAVEKDFYLTRLIWALAEVRGERLLLKGGTCLSKVDLGYRRLSEDVDLVVPLAAGERPGRHKGMNAAELNRVRASLRAIASVVGATLPDPTGQVSERGAHVIWDLPYASEFGPQGITVEVALRSVLLPPRRAPLRQLLDGALAESDAAGYAAAYCWALDAAEVRAEKVRAAFTRIETRFTPFRAPRAQAIAERGIRTVRHACLDHVVILNEAHLHLYAVLTACVACYTTERPPRSLGLTPPRPASRSPAFLGPVRARPVLGGLHHTDECAA